MKRKTRLSLMKYHAPIVVGALVLTIFVPVLKGLSNHADTESLTQNVEAVEAQSDNLNLVYFDSKQLIDASNLSSTQEINSAAKAELLRIVKDEVMVSGTKSGEKHFGREHAAIYAAYAYRITGETKYADKAASILIELINSESPVLKNRVAYSLAAANEVLMRSQRTSFRSLAYALLQDYNGSQWDSAKKTSVKNWLTAFANDMKTGFTPGTCFTNAKIFWLEGIAAAGVATGNTSLSTWAIDYFKNALQNFKCGGERILDASGFWGHEMKRFADAGDDTWFYAGYSMVGAVQLAEIARMQGIDLYNFKTTDGRSLRQSLIAHVPYITGEKTWPHKGQRVSYPTKHTVFMHAYEIANAYLQLPELQAALQKFSNGRRAKEAADRLGPAGFMYANIKTVLFTASPSVRPSPTPSFVPSSRPSPSPIVSSLPSPMASPSTAPNTSAVRYERWNNIGTNVNANISTLLTAPGYPSTPDTYTYLTGLETPYNTGSSTDNNYFGARMMALLVPKVTADYTFYLSADDAAEFYISNDATPNNARKVAEVKRWMNYRDYNCTKSDAQSCSVNQIKSGVIRLTTGTKYYVEVRHVESIGEDHTSVFWQNSTMKTPEVIGSEYLQAAEVASMPNVPTMIKAVNINGPEISADGVRFEAESVSGIKVSGNRFENQSVNMKPSTSAEKARILRSSAWGGNGALKVDLPAVDQQEYSIYLYVWEDNNAQDVGISIEGSTMMAKYNTGSAGTWARLGPFQIKSQGSEINIQFTGGHANLSALELWK